MGIPGKKWASCSGETGAKRCVEAQMTSDVPKCAVYFSHWLKHSAPGEGRGRDRMEFA